MKLFICSLLFMFSLWSIETSYGQLNQDQRSNATSISDGVGVGEKLYVNKPFVKRVEGSPYLVEEWLPARIKLKNVKKLFITDLKYDIFNDYLDVLISDELKSISGINVEYFELINESVTRHFESCSNYNYRDTKLTGFLEVLYSGNLRLFERPYAYLKQATYNTALMVGERHDKIIIKKEYYYSDASGNLVLIKKSNVKKIPGVKAKNKRIPIDRGSLIEFFASNEL